MKREDKVLDDVTVTTTIRYNNGCVEKITLPIGKFIAKWNGCQDDLNKQILRVALRYK